jgi:hypothetical protein
MSARASAVASAVRQIEREYEIEREPRLELDEEMCREYEGEADPPPAAWHDQESGREDRVRRPEHRCRGCRKTMSESDLAGEIVGYRRGKGSAERPLCFVSAMASFDPRSEGAPIAGGAYVCPRWLSTRSTPKVHGRFTGEALS